ncbi:hypothetical protein KQX54_004912 [Cotesia glomerata]|uniref:Uncharacterized protein n=1 Tax=Cotesia glomerata TaxID=32391 RepID=A0AAV7J2N0_COTGL|nr:hypothetical protein KQX54_004912 [Cotesia glomerata]
MGLQLRTGDNKTGNGSCSCYGNGKSVRLRREERIETNGLPRDRSIGSFVSGRDSVPSSLDKSVQFNLDTGQSSCT